MNTQDEFRDRVKLIHRTLVILFSFVAIIACLLVYLVIDPGFSAFKAKKEVNYASIEEVDEDLIVDGRLSDRDDLLSRTQDHRRRESRRVSAC